VAATLFHSSKRGERQLPTVNSITTLLFGDKGGIRDGAQSTLAMLRRAK
jgi:hypothetical protein